MSKPKHTVLYIPAETYPTHHSLMTEVYSKSNRPVSTIFLMRSLEKEKLCKEEWNKSLVYLFPRHPSVRIIEIIRRYFRSDIRYLYLIPYILLKHRITIIQVRDLTFPLIIALAVKSVTRIKIIYQKSFPHEYAKFERAQNYPGKLSWLIRFSTAKENKILHFCMRYCDKVFPISRHMADHLHKQYELDYEKMFPLGLGFNFAQMPLSERKTSKIKITDTVKIIYVGTLSMKRKFDVLMEGIALLQNNMEHLTFEFEFAGGTDEEIETLQAICNKLAIDSNCVFYGKIDREEVYGKILNSHIGISWFGTDVRFCDASPTKMIEYLSLGIPVVAVDSVFQHREILEKTNAGVCCAVDAHDFYAKCREVIESYGTYKSKADSAMNYMERNFSYTSMANDIVNIYDKL